MKNWHCGRQWDYNQIENRMTKIKMTKALNATYKS